ncbi:bifunctional phosphoglucose/phosphomannose isomerase [Rubrivirga marina]|uniref:Bifunctional phosphoglucose/phosphomannose isomerase n=1 Tax=Rubrivirga marina TaxID=1196024 RepID=A0A271J3B9_9BACT|nr:bifunctional phosphoglucose/phosphomannose isomerase [Rubrivirga marina]PAP77455.1 bifunctional phosphoglucose/phosphomannose isomerase [Rubrivirga marina]
MADTLYDADLDPGDMRGAVRAFPEHLAEGWRRGGAADDFELDPSDLDGIVLCGMGGSAIGGDLVRGIVEPTSPLPFVVNRGYALPGWVGERTLVIASSYSGGTEETLAAFADARARGARRLAITSGGTLQGIAEADGLDHVLIPGGLQPRAALGFSLGVVLRLAQTLGLAELSDAEMATALLAARQRATRHDEDDASNPARALAAAFDGALPVVYTGTGLLEPVGLRWRTQIHENAKHPAVGNVLPELDHNEIMGFESGPEEILSRMRVVALKDEDDHAQVLKRFAATRELIEPRIGGWLEIASGGDSRLDRALGLVQLGDAASFWLAMLKGVDPTPVETIQSLKKQLA